MYRKIDLSLFESDVSNKRDTKLIHLIEYSNYKEINFENFTIQLMESLGYNSSLSKFVDIISDKIHNHISNNLNNILGFELIIKQLGTTSVNVSFHNNEIVSIEKIENNLTINYGYSNQTLGDVKSQIDHEIHHIFINNMGNKTNKNYFIINDLIQKYDGRTKAFLTLYYLSFKDEISCNIQMIFRQIGNKNVKNKEQFLEFLKTSDLYNISIKMVEFDMFRYWNEIVSEGNDKNLIRDLDIKNLNRFLNKTSIFIKNAGEEYQRRMSKVYL